MIPTSMAVLGQILLSFFLESLLLPIVGGGIGCAFGYLAHGRMVASFLSGKSLVFTLHVDGDTLAVGPLFTLAMGALGGFLPAWSATRVQPLKSLR